MNSRWALRRLLLDESLRGIVWRPETVKPGLRRACSCAFTFLIETRAAASVSGWGHDKRAHMRRALMLSRQLTIIKLALTVAWTAVWTMEVHASPRRFRRVGHRVVHAGHRAVSWSRLAARRRASASSVDSPLELNRELPGDSYSLRPICFRNCGSASMARACGRSPRRAATASGSPVSSKISYRFSRTTNSACLARVL